ncbi:IclR family transcriptional regulator [Salmonella enterica subsp. enterica serovar Choleraesuis]|nr:IclR family transcriptional regulator [Salmonella enterica subsp. enterica serovar Choleraesuis]
MTITETDRNGIQVISRAALIMRCLESEPGGLSLGAIAKRIDLPRSTVQRIVDALALEGLLEVQSAGGIRLGPALMRLASYSHIDLTRLARPFLELLSEKTGETVILVNANSSDMVILHSVVSHQALRVTPISGNFLSVYGTAGGKMLLSRMSNEAVKELLGPELKQLTENTPTLDELLVQLDQIRREGFAYDSDEHTIGVGAIAIGLDTPQGNYAIDLVGPLWRIKQHEQEIKQALLVCKDEFSRAMNSQE